MRKHFGTINLFTLLIIINLCKNIEFCDAARVHLTCKFCLLRFKFICYYNFVVRLNLDGTMCIKSIYTKVRQFYLEGISCILDCSNVPIGVYYAVAT